MISLSTEDRQTISDVLGHRIWHIEHKINQHERKELNAPDYRRRAQIEKYANEAEKLLDLQDRLNGDSE